MLMWTKKMLQLEIMHHLECSQNYSIKSGSLRNYYKGEIDNADDNALYVKSCKYKRKNGSMNSTNTMRRSRRTRKSTTPTKSTTNTAFKHRSCCSTKIFE